jgi:hypothetical protein
MRIKQSLKAVSGILLVSMFGAGVLSAALPLSARAESLCMHVVQSCSTSECLDWCDEFYPSWDTIECVSGQPNCCNCFL